MLSSLSIPHKYQNTYTDKVGRFLLVYQPLAQKGIAVLNPEAAFVYHLIDNQTNIKSLVNLAKQKDSSTTPHDINKIIADFLNADLIYISHPKYSTKSLFNQPTQLGVWLHITNQCNLRCKYCYVDKSPDSMTDKTLNTAIRNIIRDAKKHHFSKITFKFSGGECLLKLEQIVYATRLAKKLAQKVSLTTDFVVLTNGVLITESVAQTLKQEGIRAAVSCDGLGKYNDVQRVFPNGQGSFLFVEQGINNLQKYRVPFNVTITITAKNITHIPTVTTYFLTKNIPFVFNFFRENPYVSEKLVGDDLKLVKYLTKAYRLIGDHPPRYKSLLNSLLDRVTFTKPHLHACGMGNSYLVIRHDGKIVSCQMTLATPIGSINDKDLINTMKQGNFVRPKGLTVEGKVPCHNCQWKYICCGGCPLATFKQQGNYTTYSPSCAVYKALIPEALKVEAKRLINYGKLK